MIWQSFLLMLLIILLQKDHLQFFSSSALDLLGFLLKLKTSSFFISPFFSQGCISYRPDSRPRTSSSLDVEWKSCQTFSMAHSSHPSGSGEMTNGGGHPHFNSGGQAGVSHSSTRYLLKKQQRHRRRSSSPMGRVILINAPVDGEFGVRYSSCVAEVTQTLPALDDVSIEPTA